MLVDSLRACARILGTAHPDSEYFADARIVASIVPEAPAQPMANMAICLPGGFTHDSLSEIATMYREAKVTAWRLWDLSGEHNADQIAAAGYQEGQRLAVMSLDLTDYSPPDLDGLDFTRDGTMADFAGINARAYPAPRLERALVSRPSGLSIYTANLYGHPASVVATLDLPDDGLGVYFAATDRHARKRRLLSRLLGLALADAKDAHRRTAHLEASEAGQSVYARLGFLTQSFATPYTRALSVS